MFAPTYNVSDIYRESYDDELDAWRERTAQTEPAEPVTSPWVRKADEYDLPTKELTR